MFGEHTLLAAAFYLSGYLCRKKNMHFAHPHMTGLLLLLVPAITACFIKLDMQLVQVWVVLGYYVIAMIGFIGIMILSKVLSKYYQSIALLLLSHISVARHYIFWYFISLRSN